MRSGEGGGPDSALVRGRLAAGSSASTVSDSISCEDMPGRAESFAGGRREEGGDMGARPGRATAAAVGLPGKTSRESAHGLALPTQRVNRRPAHTSEHKCEPCPRSD